MSLGLKVAILDTDDYTARHLGYANSPNPNSQSECELSGGLTDKSTPVASQFLPNNVVFSCT